MPICSTNSISAGGGTRTPDTQIVDLQPAGAATIQFELKVVSVRRHELASASAAADERAEEHPDGRDVLRLLLKDRASADAMGQLAYDAHDGVMVKARTAAR